jgi:DNA-binding MarR family transcriptional regulator
VLRGTADGDRRRSVLRLSAAGRRTYQDVVPRVVAIEQQLLGQLDPAARTQLAALLDRLEQTFAAGPAPETEAPQRIPPGSS